jgi:hypothetical protein
MNTNRNFSQNEAPTTQIESSSMRSASSNSQIIKDFFQRDSRGEMIESLNAMIEAVLFADDLSQVTPEMRGHIVNQLRVATFIARLDA